jgi:mRNA interferase MazF
MRRGEWCFAETPGGGRPVLVLARDQSLTGLGLSWWLLLLRNAFRQRITRLSPTRLYEACRTLRASTGC